MILSISFLITEILIRDRFARRLVKIIVVAVLDPKDDRHRTSSLKTFFTAKAMTCDAECRSFNTSSSAFVGNVAACISSCVAGMWRATVNGARRLTEARARARAGRLLTTWPVASGMGGRLEQRLCSLPVRLALSGQLTQRSWLRSRTSIKQPCDRPQRCQRVTPVELHVGVSLTASSPASRVKG